MKFFDVKNYREKLGVLGLEKINPEMLRRTLFKSLNGGKCRLLECVEAGTVHGR